MEKKLLKLLTSLAFIFLGIMLLLHPNSVTTVLIIALGVIALGYAIINGLQFFKTRTPLTGIIAAVLACIGLVLVLQPVLKLNIYDKIFGICLAVILVLTGVLLIKESFSRTGNTKLIGMVVGALVILIGLVTLFNPSLSFLSLLMGLGCLGLGAMQLYEIISGASE